MSFPYGGELTAMEALIRVTGPQNIPAVVTIDLDGEAFPVRLFPRPEQQMQEVPAVHRPSRQGLGLRQPTLGRKEEKRRGLGIRGHTTAPLSNFKGVGWAGFSIGPAALSGPVPVQ